MAELKNCMLPDSLLYHVDFNVWIQKNEDGTLDLGMTDIAQSMAGNIIHCRPKKVGKYVKAGKSVATVESGKWVGPVKTPFAGEIVAANREVENDATILNRSPYKQGWIVRIQPSNFDENSGDLVSGDDAISGFDSYMAEKEIGDCKHCEGFEG
ncbi:MAG TPA: glycine cleavage system protein H [Candidatus Marinimicrobia bacterium]|jgi:glycine cleavage system H protein|nr:glycine cleavage system protein H [Candidatus Neomarinimicrobiota bacterium]